MIRQLIYFTYKRLKYIRRNCGLKYTHKDWTNERHDQILRGDSTSVVNLHLTATAMYGFSLDKIISAIGLILTCTAKASALGQDNDQKPPEQAAHPEHSLSRKPTNEPATWVLAKEITTVHHFCDQYCSTS